MERKSKKVASRVVKAKKPTPSETAKIKELLDEQEKDGNAQAERKKMNRKYVRNAIVILVALLVLLYVARSLKQRFTSSKTVEVVETPKASSPGTALPPAASPDARDQQIAELQTKLRQLEEKSREQSEIAELKQQVAELKTPSKGVPTLTIPPKPTTSPVTGEIKHAMALPYPDYLEHADIIPIPEKSKMGVNIKHSDQTIVIIPVRVNENGEPILGTKFIYNQKEWNDNESARSIRAAKYVIFASPRKDPTEIEYWFEPY